MTTIRKHIAPISVLAGIVLMLSAWAATEAYVILSPRSDASIWSPVKITVNVNPNDILYGLPAGSEVISSFLTEVWLNYETTTGYSYETELLRYYNPAEDESFEMRGEFIGWQANSAFDYWVTILVTCRVELPDGTIVERQAISWNNFGNCGQNHVLVWFGRGDWMTLMNYQYADQTYAFHDAFSYADPLWFGFPF